MPDSAAPVPASPTPAPPAGWWRRRVGQPLLGLLRQGLTPHQLALTVALGTACGLIPMLGVTSLLATFGAVRLRLNVAATLLIAHLWSPVQLLLIIPLLRQGARLWGGHTPTLTLDKLRTLFSHDWLAALSLLWHAIAGALLLWAGAFAALAPVLYFALRPVLRRVLKAHHGPAGGVV
ncbi:DUF2062 domain-containing protein [Hymenobacter rubripertinctus]|uniref:DUF2062 domain-containing protein n=1 Tax=Hymenobacter rubripertinctus TaxID=2029981 RepID=A0A418R116_9BACT|nr:DUF2062 domain-containing protein [Hymenobacter rubripertinctus]RIY11068.1 DUF2062 domain-containing protein [Hymenobacter rubripertinctus]